jgi:hypothetical protein
MLASLAACGCAHQSQGSGNVFLQRWYSVIEDNVILYAREEGGLEDCVGATASPETLRRLSAFARDPERFALARFELEREEYPGFSPVPRGDMLGTDRRASVRGQTFEPWCGTKTFYWVRNFTIVPHVAR